MRRDMATAVRKAFREQIAEESGKAPRSKSGRRASWTFLLSIVIDCFVSHLVTLSEQIEKVTQLDHFCAYHYGQKAILGRIASGRPFLANSVRKSQRRFTVLRASGRPASVSRSRLCWNAHPLGFPVCASL